MYSVQMAFVQDKIYFAFSRVLDSEKFVICEMTCRATRHYKQHQKNFATLIIKKKNKLTRIKIVTILNQYIIKHLWFMSTALLKIWSKKKGGLYSAIHLIYIFLIWQKRFKTQSVLQKYQHSFFNTGLE